MMYSKKGRGAYRIRNVSFFKGKRREAKTSWGFLTKKGGWEKGISKRSTREKN